MIRAGELDERVTLYSPAAGTDDGYQTLPGGWNDEGTIWAQYMPGTVRETFDNMGREGEMPAMFKVRRWTLTERINETWKLVHRGATYDIKGAVRNDRDAMHITAVATDEELAL